MADEKRHRRRPLGFRLILAEIGVLAVRSWGRAWTVFEDRERYQELVTSPAWPAYVLAYGVWGTILTLTLLGFWQRQRRFLAIGWLVVVSHLLFEFVWFAIFAQTDYDQQRRRFVLSFVVAGVLANTWMLFRPGFRSAWQAHHLFRNMKESSINGGDSETDRGS
ncbi:MAG: hypothetical protein GYB66_10495 [Chloroflexi bacterium]|nr:hypothetical protein [Chloroflexota bacterium]